MYVGSLLVLLVKK